MAKFGPGDSKVPLGISAFDDELRAIGKNLFFYTTYGGSDLYDDVVRNGKETLAAREILVARTVKFVTEGIDEGKWQPSELSRMFAKVTALYEEVSKYGRANPTVALLKKLVDAFGDPARFAPVPPDPNTNWQPIRKRLQEMAYGGVDGPWTRPREWTSLSRSIQDFRFPKGSLKDAAQILSDIDRFSRCLGDIGLDEIAEGKAAALQALGNVKVRVLEAQRKQPDEEKGAGGPRRR